MDYKYINQLLNKYWEGATTLGEYLTFILQSKGRVWQLNTVPPPICLRARR